MAQVSQSSPQNNLAVSLEAIKRDFVRSAQSFYDQGRYDTSQLLALVDAVLLALGQLTAECGAVDSSYLHAQLKPFFLLQQEALDLKKQLLSKQGVVTIAEPVLAEDAVKVYISLYQADGYDMEAWQAQLASVASYCVGRPVYKDQASVEQAIRQRMRQSAEAYVVAIVPKSAIITSVAGLGFTQSDGRIHLRSGVLRTEHIVEFVHSGQRYRYIDGQFILNQ